MEWPVGIGAKGNEGVANNVANTKGAIGYVEYAYAKQNKMTYTQRHQQGRQAGLSRSRRVSRPPRPTQIGRRLNRLLRYPDRSARGAKLADCGRNVYPFPRRSRRIRLPPSEALKFFEWAYTKGGKMAEELDYVPMPPDVVSLIKKEWSSDIKDASGKPLM